MRPTNPDDNNDSGFPDQLNTSARTVKTFVKDNWVFVIIGVVLGGILTYSLFS